MDDESLLQAMKNGVILAGHEMGPVGDHWPALHAICGGLDKEFEEIHRKEAVLGELEFHIANAIRKLEESADDFSFEEQERAQKFIKETWEEYYAIFEPIAPSCEPKIEDMLSPEQMKSLSNFKSATHILGNLGGRA